MRYFGWTAMSALLLASLEGCDQPFAVDSETIDRPRATVLTTAAAKRDQPTSDDRTIHQWEAGITFRDDASDGVVSDGRGVYSEADLGFTVAYDFSLTSSKEDRIWLGLYGRGAAPRFFRLRVPGVVEMDCGWGEYSVSYDDLFEQAAGTTVSDGHLVVRCAADRRAPRYEITFDPCVVIANPTPDRYIASTDAACFAQVDLDGVGLGSFSVSHLMQADLAR